MYRYSPLHGRRTISVLLLSASACVAPLAASAQPAPNNVRIISAGAAPTIRVSPTVAQLAPGDVIQFTATVNGAAVGSVAWTATGGTMQGDGSYTAGVLSGTYLVTAAVPGAPAGATATVTISGPPVVSIAPGENIQSVVNRYPAGTTFLLRAGIHRNQTITARTGDRFVGETSGNTRLAILSGARLLTGWAFDGARWYVSGQTQGTPPEVSGAVACRTTHPRCSNAEDLFFDNVMKYHEDALAEVGPGEWFFDYASDRIYVGDNPAGRVVETSVTPYAFLPTTATNVTIEQLIIEKFAAPTGEPAIPLHGDSWVIQQSEVRMNHGAGIGVYNRGTARNNFVHHNCGFGFVGAGDSSLVEANEIAYNNVMAGSTNTCGYDSFWGAGGSKWVWTVNLTVRGNFSHHNDGPGLWTDINNVYTVYENNILEDNIRGGIFHEISYDAVIRNNTIRRNGTGRDFPWWTTGAGIEVVSSPNVEVYGNILVDNWQGITGLDDHRGTGNRGPWALTNLNVHDNSVTSRISDGGAGRTGVLDTAGTGAFMSSANNRFQRNTYILGSTAAYFFWMGQDVNESQWRAYGQDTSGTFQR